MDNKLLNNEDMTMMMKFLQNLKRKFFKTFNNLENYKYEVNDYSDYINHQ